MAADFDPGTGLGPRLRLVRGGRELSVRELARRVGCSASLISQIERGVSVPSVGVLYSLATELSSSLDYLLFGSDQGPGRRAGDAGPDAGSEAGPDAGSEAGPDAGSEAGPDSGGDLDAGAAVAPGAGSAGAARPQAIV